MKIGIFDSGVGGLLVAKSIKKYMPQYDYVYLGDTKNLPYGDKSQNQIYKNTVRAVEYLFKQNCILVVVACNTASSQALRKIQQEWLPKSKYNGRKVLGVIRPTVEIVGNLKKVGVIGTVRTIDSTAYKQELEKINPKIKLSMLATPKLVPMIEEGKYEEEILKNYLVPFRNTDGIILGCTHYGLLKKEIRKILGPKVKIIAQEDLIPKKLKNYLTKHKEIKEKLSKNSKFELLVTKISDRYENLALKWFGAKVKPKLVKIN